MTPGGLLLLSRSRQYWQFFTASCMSTHAHMSAAWHMPGCMHGWEGEPAGLIQPEQGSRGMRAADLQDALEREVECRREAPSAVDPIHDDLPRVVLVVVQLASVPPACA